MMWASPNPTRARSCLRSCCAVNICPLQNSHWNAIAMTIIRGKTLKRCWGQEDCTSWGAAVRKGRGWPSLDSPAFFALCPVKMQQEGSHERLAPPSWISRTPGLCGSELSFTVDFCYISTEPDQDGCPFLFPPLKVSKRDALITVSHLSSLVAWTPVTFIAWTHNLAIMHIHVISSYISNVLSFSSKVHSVCENRDLYCEGLQGNSNGYWNILFSAFQCISYWLRIK